MIGADVHVEQVQPVFFFFIFAFVMVLGLAGLAVWIWALVDCIRVPDDRYFRSGNKLVWVLVIALLQVIGAIVYLVAGRPDKADRERWGAGSGSATPVPPAGPPGSASMPPPPPG